MDTQRIKAAAEALGLDDDTLELARILPLVYVAWSDGEIQAEELSIIDDQAEELGITSPASKELLGTWLAERPDTEFFKRGLRLLAYLLATLEQSEAETAAEGVTNLCEAVARASGGLSGHTVKIDATERLALREVTVRLGLGAREATRKALNDLMDLLAQETSDE